MKRRNSRILRKIIASALVLMMVTAPMSPVADVFNISTSVAVNAAVYSDSTEVVWEGIELGDVFVGPITITKPVLDDELKSGEIHFDADWTAMPEINLNNSSTISIDEDGILTVDNNRYKAYKNGLVSYTDEFVEPENMGAAQKWWKVTAVEVNDETGYRIITIKGTELIYDYQLDISALNSSAQVNVYDDNGEKVDFVGKIAELKKGYTVTSNVKLVFNGVKPTEYTPDEEENAYPGMYTYEIQKTPTKANVTVTHEHEFDYDVVTDPTKFMLICNNGTIDPQMAAELTIPAGNYEYGDKVDIKFVPHDVPAFGVAKEEITHRDIFYRDLKTNEPTNNMPRDLGSYRVVYGVDFAKKPKWKLELSNDFDISKKDIANLVKLTNGGVDDGTNKDDHIEVYLVPQNAAANLTEAEGLVKYTITYNGVKYYPVVKLFNYVYNYEPEEGEPRYVKEEVSKEDYTVTFALKDTTDNLEDTSDAGTYIVTVSAVEGDDNNYTGSGSFEWEISKRNFTDLVGVFNYDDGKKEYDGEAVSVDDFKVGVMVNDEFVEGTNSSNKNPGTETGTTFSAKWYAKQDDGQYAEMEAGEAPTDAGSYRAELTVKNKNYNDGTITVDFEITKKEIVITPSQENNITYGEFVYGEEFVDGEFVPRELAWTADLPDDGAEIGEGEVQLLVVMDRDDDGEPIYAEEDDILDAGEYDYEFSTDVPESKNYTFKLDPEVKFVVDKKDLTKEMFTVDPLELTYNGNEQTVYVSGDDSRIIPFGSLDENETERLYQLLSDTDWEIFNNTNKATDAGKYTVQIVPTEDGNYKLPEEGTLTVTVSDTDVEVLPLDLMKIAEVLDGPAALIDAQRFIIRPRPIEDAEIKAEDLPYNAKEQSATVEVKYNGKTLVVKDEENDNDYSVEVTPGKNVGEYDYTVTGTGNFTGTYNGKWNITSVDFKNVSVYGGNKTYDAAAVTEDDLKVTIKLLDDEENKAAYKQTLETTITFSFDEQGEQIVESPKDAGTYYANVTIHDPAGNYNDYVVPTVKDGEVVKPAYEFTIKKRKVELYPEENQSAPAGSNYTIAYTYEKAKPETITGVMPEDEAEGPFDFSSALKLSQSGTTPGFYEIVLDEAVAANKYKNYIPTLEDIVDFEITKAPLQKEWFKLVYDIEAQPDVEVDGHTFDDSMVKVKLVPTDVAPGDLVADNGDVNTAQVTVSGVTSAFLPEEGSFKVYVKANKNGNYKDPADGVLTYVWTINPRECDAEVSVQTNNLNVEESVGDENGYYYNGRTPNIDIISKDDDTPLPVNAEKTYTYYEGVRDAETGEVSYSENKLPAAPVNAGLYKAEGEVDAKGYKVNSVDPAEFEIKQRILFVTVDQKDLVAFYNPSGVYSIPYTEYNLDNSRLVNSGEGTPFGYIDSEKKMAPHIVGDLGLVANSDDGVIKAGDELTIDASGLKVQFGDDEEAISENYRVVVQVLNEDGILTYIDVNSQPQVVVVAAPIRENWIVFDAENGQFNKYDVKPTDVSFKVYYNGEVSDDNLLVEGEDYEVAGELSTAGDSDTYTVQVKGLVNYTYYAEKSWSVVYDENDRNTHVNAMIDALTDAETGDFAVKISDDITAKHASGKNRIYVTAVYDPADGVDGINLTKTGLIAVPKSVYESEDFDPAAFVVGGEGVTTVGRLNAREFRYGLVDETGEGLYVKAYSVIDDGLYETVVYSQEELIIFDDYVKYTVSVVDGTGTWTSDKQDVYDENNCFTGTFVKTERPIITATAADKSEEGLKFGYWLKNGVLASYSPEYSFRLAGKSVELEAVFVGEDEDVVAEPVLTMSALKTTYNGKDAIGFIFEHTVPSSQYTVTKVAVNYATNKLAGADTTKDGYALADLTVKGSEYGVDDVESVLRTAGNKVKTLKASYTLNDGKIQLDYALGSTNADAYAYAVGYVVATNLDTGEEETFFSNLLATTINKCR